MKRKKRAYRRRAGKDRPMTTARGKQGMAAIPHIKVMCPRCGERMDLLTYTPTKAYYGCEHCPPPWREGPPTWKHQYR